MALNKGLVKNKKCNYAWEEQCLFGGNITCICKNIETFVFWTSDFCLCIQYRQSNNNRNGQPLSERKENQSKTVVKRKEKKPQNFNVCWHKNGVSSIVPYLEYSISLQFARNGTARWTGLKTKEYVIPELNLFTSKIKLLNPRMVQPAMDMIFLETGILKEG